MGWLSWVFPSDEDRVEKAKKFIERGKFADARLEILEIKTPAAVEILQQAEEELARKNIEISVSWCEAGDDERARHHIEVAQNFHNGSLEEEFKEARHHMRLIRERHREEDEQKKTEREALIIALEDSPFHAKTDMTPILDELGSEHADSTELEGRLALLIDAYPSELREQVDAKLVKAVLDFEDGRADLALPALISLPDNNPLVCYERARAAHHLEDSAAALRSMRTFDRLTDKHYRIGNQHTGIFLTQLLLEAQKHKEAMGLLQELRETEPDLGGSLYAQLLSAHGKHQQAEATLLPLIKKFPSQSQLYGILANVRIAAGHPVQAMRALEASLEATHCAPGKCGYQPPDLGIIRGLAILYFENDMELERAHELAEQAASLIKRPAWEDLYLVALAGRKRQELGIEAKIQHLWEQTQNGGVRWMRLEKHLPRASA
jgi:hypothetical protein